MCNFSQILRKVAIWGQLWEIATSQNIWSPVWVARQKKWKLIMPLNYIGQPSIGRCVWGGGSMEVWIKNEMSQSNRLSILFLNCFEQTSWRLLEVSKMVCLSPYEVDHGKMNESYLLFYKSGWTFNIYMYKIFKTILLCDTYVNLQWLMGTYMWTHFYIVSITFIDIKICNKWVFIIKDNPQNLCCW